VSKMSSRCTDSTNACVCGHVSFIGPDGPAVCGHVSYIGPDGPDHHPGDGRPVPSGCVVRDVQLVSGLCLCHLSLGPCAPGPCAPAGRPPRARSSHRRRCSCRSQRTGGARCMLRASMCVFVTAVPNTKQVRKRKN
jgi:hypothetical protein